MADTRRALITRITEFLRQTGMSERQFGLAVAGDHKFVKRLCDGAGVTLTTIERAERLMANHDKRPKRQRRAA